MLVKYQDIINQFTQANFKLTYDGEIKINPNLKHIGARYVIDTNTIEISQRVVNAPFVSQDIFKKLLDHEALHWSLKQIGLPYQDHEPDFESFLAQFKLPTSDPNSNVYGPTKKAILCYEHGTAYIDPNTGELLRAKLPYYGGYKIFKANTSNIVVEGQESNRIPLTIKLYQ